MPMIRLKGRTAAAVEALLTASPPMARKALSWSYSYVHALSVWLQSRDAKKPQQAKRILADTPDIARLETKDLLIDAGFAAPQLLMPLMDRLGPHLYAACDYYRWASLMADRAVLIHLAQCKGTISGRRLDALGNLDPELRALRVMERIRHQRDVDALQAALAHLTVLCPDTTRADLLRSLKSTRSDLKDWFSEWRKRARFPEPPAINSGKLVPVRSAQELKRTALYFRNCLWEQLDEVILGRFAVFVWCEEPQAVIALRPVGRMGWTLSEAKARDNNPVPKPVMRRIFAELEAWEGYLPERIEESLEHIGFRDDYSSLEDLLCF